MNWIKSHNVYYVKGALNWILEGGLQMMCKYCDEDRLVGHGAIWFGEKGKMACINKNDELVVNIGGEQVNTPINFCPFCGGQLRRPAGAKQGI